MGAASHLHIEARPWSTSYSEKPNPLPLVPEGLWRKTFVLVLSHFSLEAILSRKCLAILWEGLFLKNREEMFDDKC